MTIIKWLTFTAFASFAACATATEEESATGSQALTQTAADESYARLGAKGGTTIRIFYKTEATAPNGGGGLTVVATAPRFEVVSNGSINRVDVALKSVCTPTSSAVGATEVRDEGSVSLTAASPSTLSGKFPKNVQYYSADYRGYGRSCEEELKVTVDGSALIDPVSGTDTFRFRFAERQGTGKKKPIQLTGSTRDQLELTYETKANPAGPVFVTARNIKVSLTDGPFYERKDYKNGGKAQAVLINKCLDAASGSRLPDTTVVRDLALVSGAYEGTLDDVPLTQTVGRATYGCTQEITAVVDGRWIKSKSNENFNFAFSEYCSPSCRP